MRGGVGQKPPKWDACGQKDMPWVWLNRPGGDVSPGLPSIAGDRLVDIYALPLSALPTANWPDIRPP